MSARDKIHDAVKTALIKDGWTITADPLRLEYGDFHLEVDLEAEKALEAEKDGTKIAVEIKSFLSPSTINDLKQALGSFNLYVVFLRNLKPQHRLWLAISDTTFEELFSLEGIELIFEAYKIPLIIVDIKSEEVVKWISEPHIKI